MNHPLRSSAKREHIIMFQKWQKNLFSQNLQNLTKGKREQTKLTTIRKRNNRVFHQFFKTKFFYYAQNMRNILPFLRISFCFHFIYFLFYPFVNFFAQKSTVLFQWKCETRFSPTKGRAWSNMAGRPWIQFQHFFVTFRNFLLLYTIPRKRETVKVNLQ